MENSSKLLGMAFLNKLKWILGILVIFALVLATNLIDRSSFKRVNDAIVTIYKDRLVVSEMLFKMNNLLHDKELAVAKEEQIYFNSENETGKKEIEGILGKYEETKLTADESRIFEALKSELDKLDKFEKGFRNGDFSNSTEFNKVINECEKLICELSDIQITEGGRQVKMSKKDLGTVDLFTQIEIYILVLLAIAIQVVIMYQPKFED